MPDRYGDEQLHHCRNPGCRCRNPDCRPPGWLGTDEEGRPIPCLECKDHLLRGTTSSNDYAERIPSARAQAAIDRDNDEGDQ